MVEAMMPTEPLMAEHLLIQRMLKILDMASYRLATGEDINFMVFENISFFARNFADRCHHGKEEEVLFKFLEKHGVLRDEGLISIMLLEHKRGREYVETLQQATHRLEDDDRLAAQQIRDVAEHYMRLIEDHIDKEQSVLFPMAERLLTEDEKRRTMEEFEALERERIGRHMHEQCHRILLDLEREFGLAVA